MKRIISLTVIIVLVIQAVLAAAVYPVSAEPEGNAVAQIIKYKTTWKSFSDTEKAVDGKQDTYASGTAGGYLILSCDSDIGFLYIEFNKAPGTWKLTSGSGSADCGQKGFIHEYADVSGVFGSTKSVTLTFPEGAEIAEIHVYGVGVVPSDVQLWDTAWDTADILLLSCHSDDDQLYFAGVIPYYTQVRKVRVQVVFFTEHLNDNIRWHERLDALWTAGLRNYPVVSEFPDAFSTTLSGARSNFAKSGFTEEEITAWLAYQIRRFRPLVAVTHSYDGEAGIYTNGAGHGQHMAAAEWLTAAVEIAANSGANIRGLEAYDLPKLYIHCYEENKILLDLIDKNYDELGGISPFNVSQNAFLLHESQYTGWSTIKMWMWGTNFPVSKPETISVKKASQISLNCPLNYGLKRHAAAVPADSLCNDFLENLTPYDEIVPETTVEETTAEPIESTEVSELTTDTEAGEISEAAEPQTVENTFEPREIEHTGGSRKMMLTLVCVISAGALVVLLYFGIAIIRRCDRR